VTADTRTRRALLALAVAAAALGDAARPANAEAGDGSRQETFLLRGQAQPVHLYGTRGAPAAVVTSGDGGWVHLGPDVARFLAAKGWFVVGFDAKAYLSSFTSGAKTLDVTDVPSDYAALADHAAQGAPGPPVLLGVSEGAGLSVLAAGAPAVQRRIAGDVALGLPDRNELGWRFRDSMIYVTKKVPNEPLFSARDYVGRVAPVPFALFRSSHDEFVPQPESEALWAQAKEPRRLWAIDAADHRFSDRQPELQRGLLEALEWIARQTRPQP
jgi:hypothetical protein